MPLWFKQCPKTRLVTSDPPTRILICLALKYVKYSRAPVISLDPAWSAQYSPFKKRSSGLFIGQECVVPPNILSARLFKIRQIMQQAGHWLLTKIVAFSRKIWGCRKKKSCVFAPHETAPKDVVKEAISIHYMALWRVLLHKNGC